MNVSRWLGAVCVAAVCAGCGGGSSSVTTYSGVDNSVVVLATPTGSNTTELIVDSGPVTFSSGAANVPYVTVTVCLPNSGVVAPGNCATIDHVFLDTGSYGLRLLKSSVAALSLPPLALAADALHNTPAGTAVECYPFVLGGVWGPMARADVHVAGETAAAIPIQIIDDPATASLAQQSDCVAAAGGQAQVDDCVAKGGGLASCTASAAGKVLFNTVSSLQANGILGVGMIPYDCGLACTSPANYAGFHIQYYVCPDSVAGHCQAAAVPIEQQAQNPVAHFVPDDGNPSPDNNGTIIHLPALSATGATLAKGRLVFGIGTRSNNQIAPGAKTIFADVNPSSPSYLYFTTTIGSTSYPESYIDSGSNAYFFNDATIPQSCASNAGSGSASGWYCPPGSVPLALIANLTDWLGNTAPVNFSIDNADALFGTASSGFNNLGGSISAAPKTFVWGLSFFFGRSVTTSIWGQTLSTTSGPWNAFETLTP